jgi:D-aminoacyl-tRNA deacylase
MAKGQRVMRAVVQRVSEAKVCVNGRVIGSISKGSLVLLGVQEGDTEQDLDYVVKKVTALRIFPDEAGKMNLSLEDIRGELLVISQFTLIADTAKGNRPSFFQAAKPELAKPMMERALQDFRKSGLKVETGEFGADMKVSLLNDGPVTILLDSRETKR